MAQSTKQVRATALKHVLHLLGATDCYHSPVPAPTGLPPFNNALAARSFRALQLRPGMLTSAIDTINRWSTRLLGFNGFGTVMKSLLGI